jgi:hypothetical protein
VVLSGVRGACWLVMMRRGEERRGEERRGEDKLKILCYAHAV